MSFFTYVLVGVGAFSGPTWLALVTAVAAALAFVLVLLRVFRSFDRIGLAVCVAMMVAEGVVNPSV